MNIDEFIKTVFNVCKEDEEFLGRSRYVDGNVRLGIGANGFVLRFCGGLFTDVVPESSTVRWDYEVTGPEAEGARIWTGEIDFMEATHPLHGSVRIRGDMLKFAADIEAIARLARLMPLAAGRLGVDAKLQPAPPQGKADPWSTRHEVIGRYTNVAGVRTYYETFGEKGGLTFIGLHSAGRDCRQWQQMADLLCEVGEFMAVDFPGHGKSWPLAGGRCLTTPHEMSNFVWSFRRSAGIEGPTVILGCSMGGNFVFQIAATHPDEVAALVSFEGADFTPEPPESALLLMDHPRVNPAYYHGAQSAAVTGKRTAVPQLEYLRWEIRTLSSVTIRADLTAYSRSDFRDQMPKVKCPALLIRGQDDYLVFAERVEETAKRLINAPSVELIMPEGVGHYAHVEQPVELGRLVLDFLKRHGLIS